MKNQSPAILYSKFSSGRGAQKGRALYWHLVEGKDKLNAPASQVSAYLFAYVFESCLETACANILT